MLAVKAVDRPAEESVPMKDYEISAFAPNSASHETEEQEQVPLLSPGISSTTGGSSSVSPDVPGTPRQSTAETRDYDIISISSDGSEVDYLRDFNHDEPVESSAFAGETYEGASFVEPSQARRGLSVDTSSDDVDDALDYEGLQEDEILAMSFRIEDGTAQSVNAPTA